jgi:hypothetical protein
VLFQRPAALARSCILSNTLTLPFYVQSDTGAFSIYGLSVAASAGALAQLQALAPLLAPLGSALNVTAGGSDTGGCNRKSSSSG